MPRDKSKQYFQVPLDPVLHDLLKQIALEENRSMQQQAAYYLKQAIEKDLEDTRQGRGKEHGKSDGDPQKGNPQSA